MPVANPTTSLPKHDVNLILAYVAYFNAEPKYVNELVTGACQWPPQTSYATLADRAREGVEDITYLQSLKLVEGVGPRLCRLLAAVKVLEVFEHNRVNPEGPFEASETITARVTELLGPIEGWNPGLAGMIAGHAQRR